MNIQQMMKQAQSMQKKMQEVQKKMDDTEVTGTAGGGAVTITVSYTHLTLPTKRIV